MKKIIKKVVGYKLAFYLFVTCAVIGAAYHVLIISRLIDYANVWGGRLTSVEEIYLLEPLAFITQIILIVLATLKYRNSGSINTQKRLSTLLYVLSALLLINTFGNLMSTSMLETIIFTPMTLVMSVASFRLALGKHSVK